jgi:hypothetical protein
MLYLSKPRGTHAVFPTQQDRNDYKGAFDVIRLDPGSDYPNGSFIGNRETLDEAREWADTCDDAAGRSLTKAEMLEAIGEDPTEDMEDLMMDFNSAVAIIAQAMLAFDNYVSNEHGACSTVDTEAMMTAAHKRYEKLADERG